jgi:hypothetical protein
MTGLEASLATISERLTPLSAEEPAAIVTTTETLIPQSTLEEIAETPMEAIEESVADEPEAAAVEESARPRLIRLV